MAMTIHMHPYVLYIHMLVKVWSLDLIEQLRASAFCEGIVVYTFDQYITLFLFGYIYYFVLNL